MKQRYIKLNNKVISTSSIYNTIENPIYDYIDKWFKKRFNMQFNHYALFEKDCVIFTKEQIETLQLKPYLKNIDFKEDRTTLRNLEQFKPIQKEQFISILNADWSAFLTEQCINDNFFDPLLNHRYFNNYPFNKHFEDYFYNDMLPSIIKALIPPLDFPSKSRQKPIVFEIYNINDDLYVSVEPKFKTIPKHIIGKEYTKNEFKKIIENIKPIYSEER